MPANSSHLGACAYIGVHGLCGRKCFREVCGYHRGKKSLSICRKCGERGTSTTHGYCTSVASGCRWKSQYESRLLKDNRQEMEDYIERLLLLDWSAYSACVGQPTAAFADHGSNAALATTTKASVITPSSPKSTNV